MRARNIKPGFFKNEVLGECHPLARILFAGLWCMADKAGRLEDRPRKIKAECLPFDEVSVETLLDQLAHHKFITRYEVAGGRYIEIPNFVEHQHPHHKEEESKIPACPKQEPSKRQARSKNGSSKAQASQPNPSDSGFLIPDSLIPDSGASSKHPLPPAAAAGEHDPSMNGVERKTRARTPRDELFDAVAEVSASDPDLLGPRIGKAVNSLLEAKPPYTPEEVRRLPEAIAAHGLDFTVGSPDAVVKHIGKVRAPPKRRPSPEEAARERQRRAFLEGKD